MTNHPQDVDRGSELAITEPVQENRRPGRPAQARCGEHRTTLAGQEHLKDPPVVPVRQDLDVARLCRGGDNLVCTLPRDAKHARQVRDRKAVVGSLDGAQQTPAVIRSEHALPVRVARRCDLLGRRKDLLDQLVLLQASPIRASTGGERVWSWFSFRWGDGHHERWVGSILDACAGQVPLECARAWSSLECARVGSFPGVCAGRVLSGGVRIVPSRGLSWRRTNSARSSGNVTFALRSSGGMTTSPRGYVLQGGRQGPGFGPAARRVSAWPIRGGAAMGGRCLVIRV